MLSERARARLACAFMQQYAPERARPLPPTFDGKGQAVAESQARREACGAAFDGIGGQAESASERGSFYLPWTPAVPRKRSSERRLQPRPHYRFGAADRDYVPTYVASCGAWTLALVGTCGARQLTRYRCGSWRCAKCGPAYDARLAHRISEGVELAGGVDDFCYVVLTVARSTAAGERLVARHHGRTYRTPREAHQAFRANWARLRKRLSRLVGGSLDYVWTREEHRDGFPHWNLLVRLPQFAAQLRDGDARAWKLAQAELLPHVVGSGFGSRFWIEAARERDKLSSYLVKRTHGERDSLPAEFAKASQLPVAGPKGARRWGSSRGFAPAPVLESAFVGGALVRGPLEHVRALDSEGQLESVWASAGAYDAGAPAGLTHAPAVHVARAGRLRARARAGDALGPCRSREQASEACVPAGRDGCDGGLVPFAEQLPPFTLSGPPALRPKGAGGHGHGVEFATPMKRACVDRLDARSAGALLRLVSLKNKGPREAGAPKGRPVALATGEGGTLGRVLRL